MEKEKLKLFYEVSVVYSHPKRNYLISRYRLCPFDLSGRVTQLERLIKEGKVVSFMIETIFDF